MRIIKEFREFIARGNVIDLAVGVIIGAAFSNIVKSFAASVFALVKVVNQLKREEAAKPEPTKTEALLGEIRDLLKKHRAA